MRKKCTFALRTGRNVLLLDSSSVPPIEAHLPKIVEVRSVAGRQGKRQGRETRSNTADHALSRPIGILLG